MVIRAAARPRHLTSPRIAATQIAQDVANTSKTMRGSTLKPATNIPPTSRAPESIATIPKNHNRPIRTASRAIAATSSLHSVLPRSLRRSSTVVRRPPARRAFSDRECFDNRTWWRKTSWHRNNGASDEQADFDARRSWSAGLSHIENRPQHVSHGRLRVDAWKWVTVPSLAPNHTSTTF